MKTKYRGIGNFSFRPVSVEEVKKKIRDLKTNKAFGGEIPTKILKECEFIIFLDSTKLKIVWKKITTFFKRRVSIIL